MSKMSKAIAVLGVVAGLGVAALPLSSYAAGGASNSKSAQVKAEVAGAISITVQEPSDTTLNDGDGVSFAGDTLDLGKLTINGAVSTGAMGVKVSTNNANGYTLTIKATTPGMVGSDGAEGFTIPAVAPAQNTAGWGYKKTTTDTNWSVLSETDAELKKTTSAPGSESDPSEVTDIVFGASANSSTHDGTYTGTVIFTATAN